MPRQQATTRDAFFPFTRGLVLAADPRLTPFVSARPGLVRLYAEATTSVWAMDHVVTMPEVRDLATARPRPPRGGVDDLRLVVHPQGLSRCRMASSVLPSVHSGPATHHLVVVDGRRAVLRDAVGDAWWVTTDPGIVGRAVQEFEAVWAASQPVLRAGEPPPFTERMVEVASLLLQGATDRQVARELRVSERTVSAEVREIARRLGATGRTHAIALLSAP